MFDVNEYGASSDASARRTSNQLFMAAKYGGFEADPSNAAKNPYNTRGNPFVYEKDGTNNKFVWEDTDTRTTRTGEANTYFLQSDATGNGTWAPIPVNTVNSDENGKYVFVAVQEGNKLVARKKTIVIGESYNQLIEVKSGVVAKDQLITDGYQGIYDGQIIKVQ